MSEIYGTFSTAYVEAMRLRLSALEPENNGLAARVAELERELEQAKADRARAAMDARNPLMAQLAELEARCKRLEEAMELVAQMRQRWLEAADNGYAGAYYAFVKNKDDEWDAIMQAKEAKP